jgi:hypothetical protein
MGGIRVVGHTCVTNRWGVVCVGLYECSRLCVGSGTNKGRADALLFAWLDLLIGNQSSFTLSLKCSI